MIPEVHASEFLAHGPIDNGSPAVLKAYSLLSIYGVLILRGIHAQAHIEQLRAQFDTEYADYQQDKDYDDALGVGAGRTMVSVRVQGAFADPQGYANPALWNIFDHALSDEFVVGAMSVVVAVPGAKKQHGHYDHPRLFGDDNIEVRLPPYAINVLTPLVDIKADNGATVVHPGSHMMGKLDKPKSPGVAALMQRGDCLLMDVRTWHSGRPNKSERARPLLSTTYYRPWFRDSSNHTHQPELVLDHPSIAALSKQHQALFAEFRYKR